MTPTDARFRTVQVIMGLGPDVLSAEDAAFLNQIIGGGANGDGVSDACSRRVSVIQLDECFSDVSAKASDIQDGVRARADWASSGDPPTATSSTELVEYFDWLFEGAGV